MADLRQAIDAGLPWWVITGALLVSFTDRSPCLVGSTRHKTCRLPSPPTRLDFSIRPFFLPAGSSLSGKDRSN